MQNEEESTQKNPKVLRMKAHQHKTEQAIQATKMSSYPSKHQDKSPILTLPNHEEIRRTPFPDS